MKRPQLQSLKRVASGLWYTLLGIAAILEILLNIASVLLVVGITAALPAAVIYSLVQLGAAYVDPILMDLVDMIAQLTTDLPAPPRPEDNPEGWAKAEESVWEPVFEAIKTMGYMMVLLGIWAAFLLQSLVDSSEDTRRAEPMTIEELEEHYESQYENGEITQEEHDERIEMVYEIKGLEDDDQ